MKCIVVDDEMASRSVLMQLCKTEPEFEILGEFEGCLDALKFLNDNEVDIIFLDLHMEVFDGFDLLKTISNDQKIVLTTSDKDFASKSYEYSNIIDYLVKPITRERFEKAVDKVRKQFVLDQFEQTVFDDKTGEGHSAAIDKVKRSMFVNIDRRLVNIKFDDIKYVEANGDYINIHTSEEIINVHTTLKKIKERLPDVQFMQVHRSYIINFEKIVDIQDNTVLIEKKVIPISRSNRPTLLQRLNL